VLQSIHIGFVITMTKWSAHNVHCYITCASSTQDVQEIRSIRRHFQPVPTSNAWHYIWDKARRLWYFCPFVRPSVSLFVTLLRWLNVYHQTFIFIQFTAIKSNQKQHNDKNNTAEGQPGHKMALMATHIHNTTQLKVY